MPIRFFCEHCKQMLKIGTSKIGSVVNCPRCQKSIVVPLTSAPLAEEAYRQLKSQRVTAPPPPTAKKNPAPVPAWETLEEEDIDDANMPLWMEESWMPSPADPLLTEEVTLHSLDKRHKLTVTLLTVSMIVLFFVGMIVGVFLRGSSIPSNRSLQQADAPSSGNTVLGTLYYLNENGERRPDVGAVVIALPKDRQPSTLFSCQGLCPTDVMNGVMNNDTIQMIHEMGGMYESTDANGSFEFPCRVGVRYWVLLISAHQKRADGEIKSSMMQELRRYFRDPDGLGESCLHLDQYEWGKYTYDFTN